MHRQYPKARRATALTLLTSIFLVLAAASAVAIHPSPAAAGTNIGSIPPASRAPLPGDPNTPDEGRRGSGSIIGTSTSTATSPARTFFDWLRGFAIHYYLPLR
jgi:hypothetical protein